MSPILESIGSVKGFGWGAFAAGSSFESISTVTVGSGGSSTITFSSIPSTYTHLQIRILARTNRTSFQSDYIKLVANSDTGSNYVNHYLVGTVNNSFTGGTTANTSAFIQRFSGNAVAANIFGAAIVDILDYKNTNKYKTIRTLGGIDENNAQDVDEIGLYSSLWLDTSAISSITLSSGGGTLLSEYSSFALYGIRGA